MEIYPKWKMIVNIKMIFKVQIKKFNFLLGISLDKAFFNWFISQQLQAKNNIKRGWDLKEYKALNNRQDKVMKLIL